MIVTEITLCSTLALVSVATITDLRSRRIPNWLVLPFLVLGPAIAAFSGGIGGMKHSLLGVLAATLIMGPFHLAGGTPGTTRQ